MVTRAKRAKADVALSTTVTATTTMSSTATISQTTTTAESVNRTSTKSTSKSSPRRRTPSKTGLSVAEEENTHHPSINVEEISADEEPAESSSAIVTESTDSLMPEAESELEVELKVVQFSDDARAFKWNRLRALGVTITSKPGHVIPFPHESDLWIVCHDYGTHQVQATSSNNYTCDCEEFTGVWRSLVCSHTLAVALHLKVESELLEILIEQFNAIGWTFSSGATKNAMIAPKKSDHKQEVIRNEAFFDDRWQELQNWPEHLIRLSGYSLEQWAVLAQAADELARTQETIRKYENLNDLLVVNTGENETFMVERHSATVPHLALFTCSCERFRALNRACVHTLAVAIYMNQIDEFKTRLRVMCTPQTMGNIKPDIDWSKVSTEAAPRLTPRAVKSMLVADSSINT